MKVRVVLTPDLAFCLATATWTYIVGAGVVGHKSRVAYDVPSESFTARVDSDVATHDVWHLPAESWF